MKKISAILLAGLMLASGSMAWAVQKRQLPNGPDDRPISHPLYGGFQYHWRATAAELVICTSKCLFAGLWMSSGALTNSVTIRDTAQANDSVTKAFDQIKFTAGTQADHVLPYPVLFTNGISVELDNITNGERVTVLYMDLD